MLGMAINHPRTQSCNCLAIWRAPTGTHTLFRESSSHRNLHQFPLSDPASLTQPATPCPQQLPHISNTNQPPTLASNSFTLFPERGYSVTEKSPPGVARFEFQSLFSKIFLYCLFFFLATTIIASFQTSTHRSHSIMQSLTAPLAIWMGEDEPVSDTTVFLTKENKQWNHSSVFSDLIFFVCSLTKYQWCHKDLVKHREVHV